MAAATPLVRTTATHDAITDPLTTDARVIVFNDHPVFRSNLSWKIDDGARVTVIADSPSLYETIVLAKELEPDAIIADMRIGDGNSEGFDSVATLAGKLNGIPIIVNSDYVSRSFVARMVTAGASAVAAKSSDPAGLVAAVREAVAGASGSKDEEAA